MTALPVSASPVTKSNTAASSGTARTLSNSGPVKRGVISLGFSSTAQPGEQRRHGVEQREHHRRIPRADDAAERVGHELRAHLDRGHGARGAVEARLLERAGRIFEPAADVAHRDEALQIRGVAAPRVLGIGLGDGGSALAHLAEPARHHGTATREARARPSPAGSRAAAPPCRPLRRRGATGSSKSMRPERGLRTGRVLAPTSIMGPASRR